MTLAWRAEEEHADAGDWLGSERTLERIEQRLAELAAPPPAPERVSSVIVLASSSRGGSSALHELLTSSHQLDCLRGEYVPFLRRFMPIPRGSDELPGELARTRMARLFARACLADAAPAAPVLARADAQLYQLELALRLPLQWPNLHSASVEESFAGCVSSTILHGHMPVLVRDRLRSLAAQRRLDLGYYAGGTPTQGGPPHAEVLEEPPFVPVLPRARAPLERDVRLLLKAPLAAYQLDFLRGCFPNADFKVIHLLRNPAASINGLLDGWKHWGFFSADVREMREELAITGYSEQGDWSRWFWKFDQPPGWQDYCRATLLDVCALQWRAAHQHVLQFRRDHADVPCLELKFEDLVQGAAKRQRALNQLADFLGIAPLPAGDGAMPGSVVMATTPPRAGRWRAREAALLPHVTSGPCADVARQLGYDPGALGDWL